MRFYKSALSLSRMAAFASTSSAVYSATPSTKRDAAELQFKDIVWIFFVILITLYVGSFFYEVAAIRVQRRRWEKQKGLEMRKLRRDWELYP